jgi:IS30 family transposase
MPGSGRLARGTTRKEQKAAFFALLDRAASGTAAAPELGLNVNTCYQWVWKAGLAGKRPDPGRRDEFFRLRKAGVSRREAARTVRVHPRTAQEWDCGIRKTDGRRIYPDGRVVDYKRGVTTMDDSHGHDGSLPAGLSLGA